MSATSNLQLIQQQIARQQPLSPTTNSPTDTQAGGGIDPLHWLGQGLHYANEGLGLSNKYAALPILGLLSRGLASNNIVGRGVRELYSNPISGGILRTVSPIDPLSMLTPKDEEAAKKVRAADSLTGAYHEQAKSLNFAQKMALEVLADPTTWVTAGSAEAIAKLPVIVRATELTAETIKAAEAGDVAAQQAVTQANRIKTVLAQAKQGAHMFEKVQALPITGTAKVAKFVGYEAPARVVGKVAGAKAEEGFRNALTGESARSKLVSSVEQAHEALNAALNKGVGTSSDQGVGFAETGIGGLVGSGTVQQATQNAAHLNSIANNPITLRNTIAAMSPQELQAAFNTMKPTDPAYAELVSHMRSKNFITQRVIPSTETLGGGLESITNPHDINNLSQTNQTFLGRLNTAIKSGDQGAIDRLMNKATDKQRRLAHEWSQLTSTGGIMQTKALTDARQAQNLEQTTLQRLDAQITTLKPIAKANPKGPERAQLTALRKQRANVNNRFKTATAKVKDLETKLKTPTNGLHDPTGFIQTNLRSANQLVTTPARTENVLDPSLQHAINLNQSSRATPVNAMSAPEIAVDQQAKKIDANQTVDNVTQFVAKDIANNGGNAAQETHVNTMLKTMFADVNPDHFHARALWDNNETRTYLRQAMGAATPEEANRYLGLMADELNMDNTARGYLMPAALRFLDRFLPNTAKTGDRITRAIGGEDSVYGSVVRDTHMRALDEMFNNSEIQALQKQYEADRTGVVDIFNKYQQAGVKPIEDGTTARDLHDALQHITDDKDVAKVKAFLKKYDMDVESFSKAAARSFKNRVSNTIGERAIEKYSIANAYSDTMIKKWTDLEAARLGVDMKRVEKMSKLGLLPQLWREQALVSPRYHLANVLDMSIKSLIYGVNPIRSMGAKDLAHSVGMQSLPIGVFATNDTTDVSQLLRPAEAMSVSAPTAWSKVPIVGRIADPIIKMNRAIARTTENSFREMAWHKGVEDTLKEFRPTLDTRIRDMLPEAQAEALIEDLNKKGGMFPGQSGIRMNAEEIRGLAQAHGASTEVANRLSQDWGAAVEQASSRGVELADKVHFNFDKTYNIEDRLMLRKFLPFHFFASRNIPFYLETFAARPELVNVWQSYQDVSEQDRINLGMPSRMRGMVRAPDFMQRFLGPGIVFFNPSSAISMLDQAKNIQTTFNGDPFAQGNAPFFSREQIGESLNRLGGLGFSPAPWVQIPLSMLGAYGPNDEPMPVFRASGVVEGVTGKINNKLTGNNQGFDMGEGLIRTVENAGRAIATGKHVQTFTGSQQKDNQIVSILQGWGQDAIDNNPDSPIVQEILDSHPDLRNAPPTQIRALFQMASKEGPGNPIWDAAAKKARGDAAARAVRGFWFPVPAKDATKTGLRIEQAQSQLNAVPGVKNSPGLMAGLQYTGDIAAARKGFQRPAVYDAAGNYVPAAGNQETAGSNADASQLSVWGGQIWGPDKPAPFNNFIAMEAYVKWAQRQPQGMRSPQQFFAEYGITG